MDTRERVLNDREDIGAIIRERDEAKAQLIEAWLDRDEARRAAGCAVGSVQADGWFSLPERVRAPSDVRDMGTGPRRHRRRRERPMTPWLPTGPCPVAFDAARHAYSLDGRPLRAVSALLRLVSPPFDPEGKIARRLAIRSDLPTDVAAREIPQAWEAKKERACDKGRGFHEALQGWVERGEHDPAYARSYEHFQRWPWRGALACETILWNDGWGLAGTSDLLERTGERSLRVYDFKTNERLEKSCRWNRYLLPPVDHLDDCNFSKYELQLSLYGLMLEQMGWAVERLTVFHIDEAQTWTSHRCRFLRDECLAILARHPAPRITRRNDYANQRTSTNPIHGSGTARCRAGLS